MVLPVISQTLLEGSILLLGDVGGFALPDGFVLVHLLELVVDFLDLLFLLLLLGLAFFLDFTLFLRLLLLSFVFSFVVRDFLLLGLLDLQLDRELDELGVLADDVLEFLLVEVLQLVVLHVHYDACSAFQVLALLRRGGPDLELAASLAYPYVGFELVLLGDDGHLVGDQEAGLESDSELSNQRHVG